MKNRRKFLKLASLTGLAAGAGVSFEAIAQTVVTQGKISIKNDLKGKIYSPLEKITVNITTKGILQVYDAKGNVYTKITADGTEKELTIGGALGYQLLVLTDKSGKVLDALPFQVDTNSNITDSSGNFSKLFQIAKNTLYHHSPPQGKLQSFLHPALVKGNIYHYYLSWFQDNYYVFKGVKYFFAEVKGYIDLFAETQHPNGMIYDHVEPTTEATGWANRFPEGFVIIPKPNENTNVVTVRTPAENMGEYTFIEALYYVWQATGDTLWMQKRLDNALRALEFSRTSPYYWSEKFQLMKRGHTIDFWDYQGTEDAQIAGDDIMNIILGKSRQSIMFGDNVRMARSCELLAEMLEFVGRKADAQKVLEHGNGLRERIDKLAWNGEFYRHQTPEDPNVKRDFGNTDESKQVVLSNSYVLNANISHDKCVAIIKTYQRIRREMPQSSPGEWYLCYPPFEKGFHNPAWDYMNGGVSPITAGELAHGAFWHGYEAYGADILNRVKQLAEAHGNHINCVYKGKVDPQPKVNFALISLKAVANASFDGAGAPGVPGWTNEGDNDLHEFPTGNQTFLNIPFDITNPALNGRKGAVVLSGLRKEFKPKAEVALQSKADTIYLLHACGGAAKGFVIIKYTDGSEHYDYMDNTKCQNWWMPKDTAKFKVAWRGKNTKSMDVGVGIYPLQNPNKDKTIRSITFEAAKTYDRWMILGLTLADNHYDLFKTDVSYGIPDNWAAGAIMFALMEGLAGVKDAGLAFDNVTIAPRWAAANENTAVVTAKYEASKGYVTYQYQLKDNKLTYTITSSAGKISLECLMPNGKPPKNVKINGVKAPYLTKTVENSLYTVVEINTHGIHIVECEF